MEYATITVDKIIREKFRPVVQPMSCDRCGLIWSSEYEDYSGMQDPDFIICSCGEIICQVGDLKIY